MIYLTSFFRAGLQSHSHVQKMFYFVENSQDTHFLNRCSHFPASISDFNRSLKASTTPALIRPPSCILSLSVPVRQAVAYGYIKDGSSWNLMPVIIKTVITDHADTGNIN